MGKYDCFQLLIFELDIFMCARDFLWIPTCFNDAKQQAALDYAFQVEVGAHTLKRAELFYLFRDLIP